MKIANLLFAIIALVVSQTLNAQDAKRNLRNFNPKPKTATMTVYGECGMCEHRIENALKIDGIKSVSWNVNTKILTVQYIPTADITGVNSIQKLLANAGHDTEGYKATESAYNSLPGCCKYQRQLSSHQQNNKHDSL